MKRQLCLSWVCAFLWAVCAAAAGGEALAVDKKQYEYADDMPIGVSLQNLGKDVEYTLLALDTYNRLWYEQPVKGNAPAQPLALTLHVPRMKGFTLALQRVDKDGGVQVVAACPVRLNARGGNIVRPDNFVHMIYGGAAESKKVYRAMRNAGLNGGMTCYEYQPGTRLAVNDFDYYHEFAAGYKLPLQGGSFDVERNWFIHNNDARCASVREDVLGHGELKKKALARLDPQNAFDAAYAQYQAACAKGREEAAVLRQAKEPWTVKTTMGAGSLGGLRATLAHLRGEFFLHRQFNWYNPDENAFAVRDIQRTVVDDWPNQPLGYSIGDEISNTNFANPFDYDYSEATLNLFREWLKKEYASLDALNAQWGTRFQQWPDVIPYTTDETKILNMPQYKRRMLDLFTSHPGSHDPPKGFSIPWDKRTPPAQRNYSSWSDFRTFQDTAWAEALGGIARAARQIDPNTPLGIVGTQAPAAFGGWDYDKLLHSDMNWIEAYDICCAKDIVRSLSKTLLPEKRWVMTRTHFGSGESGKYSLWSYVFLRDHNNVVWQLAGDDSGYFSDTASARMTERAVTQRATLLEIIDGIGRAFFQSEEPAFPLGIYLSQRSVQANWMMDSESDGSTWVQRFSSYEGANSTQNAANVSWTKLLDDLGYEYDFVGQTRLLAGDLFKGGCKVLILPKTVALSDAEAKALRQYVADGGSIIADNMTGELDGHCKARPDFQGALDRLFGIKRANYGLSEGYKEDAETSPCFLLEPAVAGPMTFKDPGDPLAKGYAPQKFFYVTESGVQEAGAKALATQGGQAGFFLNQHGQGKTLYMAASFLHYREDRLDAPAVAAVRAVMGNVLRDWAKLEPAGSMAIQGQPARTIRYHGYTFGENAWLYGLIPNVSVSQDSLGNVHIHGLDSVEPQEVEVRLAHGGHIYECRTGRYLGNGSIARTKMSPIEGLALSVLPYKVDGVTLSAEGRELADGVLRVDLVARLRVPEGTPTASHLLRFQTFNPKDMRVRYSTALVNCDKKGEARASVLLSLNDSAGAWRFSVVDIHTGLGSAAVAVEKKSARLRDLKIQDDPYQKGSAVVDAIPDGELTAKPAVFMAMRSAQAEVSKDKKKLIAKAQVVLEPENDALPHGTLTVFDRLSPELKQTFQLADVLKAGQRAVDVVLERPLSEVRDMELHAVSEADGDKREDSTLLRLGCGAFGTPKLDGELGDPVWAQASVLGDFRQLDGRTSSAYPVKARVAADDKYFYVALEADAGGAQNLVDKAVPRKGGEWYGTVNAVEILIGKTHASQPRCMLTVTWNGGQLDKLPGGGRVAWDVVAKKTEKGWNAEARIPLDALGCGAPGRGDVWLINFTSYVFRPNEEISQYAPQGRDDFNLAKFGRVIMLGNPR